MEHIYDLVIIGSGPAGLAAAVYAQRARLDTLVIEKAMVSGGQVLTTYEVDNYPGLPGIGGYDLGLKFLEHADQLGAAMKPGPSYLPQELSTGSLAYLARRNWQGRVCPTVQPATGHFSATR